MAENRRIAVYGASGLTGGFVVSDLLARGWEPVLSGRDGGKLEAVAAGHAGDLAVRPAPVGDPAALDRVMSGVAAVVNCAGPFALTAGPVIGAAVRAGVPYVDVAAEVEAVADAFAGYGEAAKEAGVVIVPAMAFYGGLGDLLATAAVGDWPQVDEICIAYALDGWRPTVGTRAAGRVSAERRGGRRIVYSHGRLEHRTGDAPTIDWDFPEPVGRLRVRAEFTTADSVTIPSHLATPELRTFMSTAAVRDLADEAEVRPSDDHGGRAAQRFLVEVVARRGADERRAVARGRDIYGISGPLAVEAATRVVRGEVGCTGVVSAGRAFDAADLLGALPLEDLSVG